jgi:hypothetical protein
VVIRRVAVLVGIGIGIGNKEVTKRVHKSGVGKWTSSLLLFFSRKTFIIYIYNIYY